MIIFYYRYRAIRKFEVVHSAVNKITKISRISDNCQIFPLKSLSFKRYSSTWSIIMSNDFKKLKTDMKQLTIGTHSGTFHCDEVLACFMLQQVDQYKDAKIVRSRDAEVLKTCDIVVDVGNVFNPDENLFDHHQISFSETMSSLRPELGDNYDIRLSSAGLIYTFFGEEVIANILKREANLDLPDNIIMLLYKKVYENFVREIDAIDNGVPMCDGEPRYNINTHLSSRVGDFNPSWNSSADMDVAVQFEKAKELVGTEFTKKVLYFGKCWLPGRDIVLRAIKNAKSVHESGEILELEQFCPWNSHLCNLEDECKMRGIPKYVLFVDNTNDWRVQCVPNTPNSFICRKFLHKDWRGLRNEELVEISGIKDASFCHSTGFIGGAKTREGALQMAVQSLNGDFVD